jgi:hypothetical protein
MRVLLFLGVLGCGVRVGAAADAAPRRARQVRYNRSESGEVGLPERKDDQRFRWSEAEWWAWEDLNLRLHPYQ